jgi:hypothetical protein
MDTEKGMNAEKNIRHVADVFLQHSIRAVMGATVTGSWSGRVGKSQR